MNFRVLVFSEKQMKEIGMMRTGIDGGGVHHVIGIESGGENLVPCIFKSH